MEPIYLDHAAATPMRPEVRASMLPLLEGIVGNPSSVHRWGRLARRRLEDARQKASELLGVAPKELHFVRGGTESVNLAILGRIAWARSLDQDVARHLLIRSAVEHSAVRRSMDAARADGWDVGVVPVAPDGALSLPDADAVRRRGAILASVQWVNHETGLVLPVPMAARWARDVDLPLHVDAVQALGEPYVRLDGADIAMASLSGHKLGGPHGTGVLVVRKDTEIHPHLFGGGQEEGLRPGTEDVAGAVGLVRALEIVLATRNAEAERIESLRDRLEAGLRDRIPEIRVHGAEGTRAGHILNVGVPGVARDILPKALDVEGIAVSAGSACRSGSTTVSPVLEALYGVEAAEVAPLRLSLGWTTTPEEIEEAIRRIPPIVERVAALGVGA